MPSVRDDSDAQPRAAALAAYWAFFDGFNSRDPQRWSAGLNFPHVRVSGRTGVRFTATREQHDREMDFGRVRATGWDRSVGAEPEVLHVSADTAHIAGGWTRYDAEGQPILVNRVGYVITRMHIDGVDHWGMQARFGIDPGNPTTPPTPEASNRNAQEAAMHAEPAAEPQADALAAAAGFVAAWSAGNASALTAHIHSPFVCPAPGAVETFGDAAGLLRHLLERAPFQPVAQSGPDRPSSPSSRPSSGLQPSMRVVQAGPAAANLAFEWPEVRGHAFGMATLREGRWAVQAISLIGG